MVKILPITIMLLTVLFLAGCSDIISYAELGNERIGVEYTVMEENEIGTEDPHGAVKNYERTLNKGLWTTDFSYMNSTASQTFTITPDDSLRIHRTIDSGDVWVKITQGDLIESDIQKVHMTKKETTVDLSRWKSGKIVVWLVVKKGRNGSIQIEHLNNDA
ncbi:hypothetical protein [Salibacterium sp. K-3]